MALSIETVMTFIDWEFFPTHSDIPKPLEQASETATKEGFKNLKFYIGCLLVMTQTKTQFYALLGVNIFQG